MKLTIKSDIIRKEKTLFTKGEVFNFDEQINIISGTNGKGKTTLLTAIRQYSNDVPGLLKNNELKESIELDDDYTIYSFFASEDDSQGIGMADMTMFLNSGGIARMNKSQGESILIGLSQLYNKLKKEDSKNNIILLDEIDRNLDYLVQPNIFKILLNLSNYGKIIYSTHNYYILSMFDSYNLNLREKTTLNELLKEVE